MLSKNTFYGKQRRENSILVQARLARQEKVIKENKVPTPYRSSIAGSSSAWKVFFKQSDAFTFARIYGKDMWVFSFESSMFLEQKGQRMYLATSLDKFWHYYRQLDDVGRHHYEIIPEGTVCHLYFDLEFDKSLNKYHDGPTMTAVFMKCVRQELKRRFSVHCSEENVLKLDSSTDAKYSCHLVFRLKNSAFHDNIAAGVFVHELCDKIRNTVTKDRQHVVVGADRKSPESEVAEHLESNGPECKRLKHAPSDTPAFLEEDFLTQASTTKQELESLFVETKQGTHSIFCDQGVYTKNRNFRLFLSCKRGKNNPLVLAQDNSYVPEKLRIGKDLTQDETDEAYFLDSLVSRVRFSPTLKILHCENSYTGTSGCARQTSSKTDCMEGQKGSPYTEVDLFLKEVLKQRGHGGYVRRWAYFHQMEMIIYDIGGDRWCDNVQRQHKSNNIMFVADLRSGVYYQKCHDPDCRRAVFRSEEWQLPEHVLPSNILSDDPWDEMLNDNEEYLTDEQLLQVEAEIMKHMQEFDCGDNVTVETVEAIGDISHHDNCKTVRREIEDSVTQSDDFDDSDVTDEQLIQAVDRIDS